MGVKKKIRLEYTALLVAALLQLSGTSGTGMINSTTAGNVADGTSIVTTTASDGNSTGVMYATTEPMTDGENDTEVTSSATETVSTGEGTVDTTETPENDTEVTFSATETVSPGELQNATETIPAATETVPVDDIDECIEETDDCVNNALCTNTTGSFRCTCREGFGGIGNLSCQKIETLSLQTISVRTRGAVLRVLSIRKHVGIQVTVTDGDGNNITLMFSDTLQIKILDLTPDTKYRVRAKILVLNNGVAVNGNVQGNELIFQTEPRRIPANMVSTAVFIPAFNNLTSPQSIDFITMVRLALFNSIPTLQTVIFIIITPGSSVATMELSTNSTNDTLDNVTSSNANFTFARIPEGEIAAPGNVLISNVTTSSFVVSFEPVNDTITYQITLSSANFNRTIMINETSTVISDLKANTDYSITVRAVVSVANSSATRLSKSSDCVIVITVSLGPQNLNVIVLTGNCVQVRFDAIAATDTYYIIFLNNWVYDFTLNGDEVVNNSLSRQVDGLKAETTYNIQVIANVDGLNSTASRRTFTTGPASVSGVTIFDVTAEGFQVEFNAVLLSPSIDVKYIVRYTSASGTQTKEVTSTNAMITATARWPRHNVTYVYYYVHYYVYYVSVAYVTTKSSPFSSNVSTDIFNIGEVTSTSVALSFDPYKDASRYNVSVFPADVMTMEVTETNATVNGLSPGTKYFIAVSTGERRLFNVSKLTCPPEVMNFTCYPQTFNCIALSWNEARSATMYTINIGDGTANITIHENGLSGQACNLTTGIMYNATIVASNAACNSTETEIVGCVTDVDECEANIDNCNSSATCNNTVGSFTCTCNTGFTGDGTNCTNINECATGSANCHESRANCTDTDGSFTCACREGYSGDGVTCTDVDECEANIDCHHFATCNNTVGSFTCTCNTGFTGDGTNCTNINECATGSANCHESRANCTDSVGTFTCACREGYNGDGVTCTDNDECMMDTDDCHSLANCTNVPGSFNCTCISGYMGDGRNCTDIDECSPSSPCDENTRATCNNTVGSFDCSCNSGYSGNGIVCEDINECNGENNCHSNAICNNNNGSFTCTCRAGYAGDGVSSCQEIETPPAPAAISVRTDQVTIQIMSVLPHIQYEVTISSMGSITDARNETSLTTIFDGLSPETEYSVTVRVTILNNNATVMGNESLPVTFTTRRQLVPVRATLVDQVFTTDLLDSSSAAFMRIQRILENLINRTGLSSLFLVIHIRGLFPGSVIAVTEMERNSSSELTIQNGTEVANFSLTGIEISTEPAPENLTASNIMTTSFTLSWDYSSSGAVQFIVEADYQNESRVFYVNSTTAQVSGLLPNTAVVLYVQALVNGTGLTVTNQSSPIIVTTLAEGPTNLLLTVLHGTSITLTFDPVANANRYFVALRGGSPQDETVEAGQLSNGMFTVRFDTLMPGTEYTVMVVPEVNGVNGTESSATATTGPRIVSHIVVYDVSLTSFSVLWTNPVTITNSDGSNANVTYVVKYENMTGPPVMIMTPSTSVTITGTPVATPYDITVAYKTSAEESPFTTALRSDVYMSSSTSPSQIEVSWVDVPDTISMTYIVQIEPTSFAAETTAGNSTTISSLTPGTKYNVTVNFFILGGTPQIGDTRYFSVEQYTLSMAPDNLNSSPLNDTCFLLTWNSVVSATSYMVKSINNGMVTDASITYNFTQPNAEVCNIATGDLHNISIVAINPAGESAEAMLVGAHSELTAPTNVSITTNGMCTCFTISWNMIPSAVSYTASLVSSEAPTVMKNSTTNEVQFCDLEAGTIYNASVYATYEAGNSLNSTDVVYQITAPPAAGNVSVTAVTTQSVMLTWDASKSATGYFVVVTQVEPASASEITEQSNATNATIGSLTAGYVYNFTVIGENSCGNSSASAVVEQITTPDMVDGFMVNTSAVRQRLVPFVWNSITGAASYNITVTRNGVELSETPISALSWDGIAGLEDGLMYNVTIVAVTDERGIQQISAPASLTFLTAPPTPANVTISNIMTNAMTVSWDASRNTDYYEVTLIQQSNTSIYFKMIVTGLEASFSSLLPGTVYNATLRANNSGGWSLSSTAIEQITVPEPTSDLVALIPVDQTSFTLTWSAVTGVMDYRVNITGGSEMINSKLSAVTNVTFDFTDGVRAGYEYNATVEVLSRMIGMQQISSAVSHTFMTAPDNTSDPVENITTETTISAYWTAARGADFYIVEVVLYSNMTTIRSLNQSGTAVSLSELVGGTRYIIQVRAHNRFGQSFSKSTQITTNPACPAFTISAVTVNSFQVNWPLSNGADGYSIEIDPDRSHRQVPPFLRPTATEATIFDLEAGTNYTVTMIAHGIKDSELPCSEIQITLPGQVMNIMCSPTNNTCFSLTWMATKSATDYNTTYTNGSTIFTDAFVDTSLPGADVCGITTGSLYNTTVSAINSVGTGLAGVAMNCHSALPIPTNVMITVTSPTCFNVTWTGFPTAISYTTNLTSTEATTVTSTSVMEGDQICRLESGVVYTANVKATYEAGDSMFSVDNDTQITAPPAPTNITLPEITTQSISLLWNPSKSALRYYIETLQTAPTSATSDVRMFVSNMATIDRLLPGHCYDIVITAENDGGNSTPSTTIQQITTPEAVQGFMVDTTNVMQLMVPLVWNASVGATSYNLTVTSYSASIASTSTNGTSWNNITGLMDGESYNVIIVAVTDQKGIVQVSAPSNLTFTTAPPTPGIVTASNISTNSMVISWSSSKSADSYEARLTQMDNTSAVFVMMTNSSTTEAMFNNLLPGRVYIYSVLASNSGGRSKPSTDRKQTTVPEAVTSLAVFRPVPQTSFRLSWDIKEGVMNYMITVTSSDGSLNPKTTTNGFVTFEYTDGVRNGTEYVASVVAMSRMVGIQQNSSVSSLTFETAPQNTSAPTLIARTDTTITVQWSFATGADYYIVDAIRFNILERSNNVTTLSTTLMGLAGGTDYEIRVGAYNNFGMSFNLSAPFRTNPSCPDFSFSNIGTSSFTVSWPRVTSARGYTMRLQTTSDNLFINPSMDPSFLGDNTLSTVVSDLVPGTNYTVSMTAHDTTKGLDSETCSLIQITVPLAPTLMLSARTSTTIGVSWAPVVGATEYYVIFMLNGMIAINETVQQTSYTGRNLIPATWYYVRVRSVNSAGFSEASFNHTTVIASGPDVTFSNILTDGFTISVSDVQGRSTFDYSVTPGSSSVTGMNSTSAMITGLQAGTEYTVIVFTNYEFVGRSDGSTPVTTTTIPAAPGDLALVSSTQSEGITLSWTLVNAAKYEITASGSGGDVFTSNFTTSPATLSDVVLGTTYNFTIRAVNGLDAFGAFGQPLNFVAAATVKTVKVQLTLNSSFEYSPSLANSSSPEFIQLQGTILDQLRLILGGTNILNIFVVQFFSGSVIVWVDIETNATQVGITEIMYSFVNSMENKDLFANDNITDRNECLENVCHMNATCNNTETSYICMCNSGFTGNGTTCTDIDECSPSQCVANANCANTIGSFNCSCNDGYTGDGSSCTDIDECSEPTPCSGGSTCMNINGSFNCNCPPGYMYNGSSCIDINECLTSTPCHANANCMNLEPSYMCTCDTGYTGDGTTCSDINECTDTSPCDDNAGCTNSNGSFTCTCKDGYTGDGATCGDVDECLDSSSCTGANTNCSNNMGSFVCTCSEGYTGMAPDNCLDIDECATPSISMCNSSATCDNIPGSFNCTCISGYTGNGMNCTVIDECDSNPCTVNETCNNFDGNYSCECNGGFSGSPCLDIDECATMSPCHSLASCSNTAPGYVCACNMGYTGNGTYCRDMDECADPNTCANNATCTNLPATFQCVCNTGYSGDGTTECMDIDECQMDNDCHANANCRNTNGSYLCTCNSGFSGTGRDCEDIDECAGDHGCPSDTSICENLPGTSRCQCITGYVEQGQNCVDVDECLNPSICTNTSISTCENTDGSFMCNCNNGFEAMGRVCIDINECLTQTCDANADCTNLVGSYLCTCNTGYTGNGTSCTRISNRVTVTQTITKYTFTAQLQRTTGISFSDLSAQVEAQVNVQFSGIFTFVSVEFENGTNGEIIARYTMETSISIPVNFIDLYYNNNTGDPTLFATRPTAGSNCPSGLNCGAGICVEANAVGQCVCFTGYAVRVGTTTCIDDDECDVAGSCHVNASCMNTPGSFDCECSTGFTGDGISCSDISECLTSPCQANATCENTVGSFTCTCQLGFIESGDGNCTYQCGPEACMNGGTCVPSLDSNTPNCICTSEYQGTTCEESVTTPVFRDLAIAFGVIGGLLLIILIVALIVYCMRRKQGKMEFGDV